MSSTDWQQDSATGAAGQPWPPAGGADDDADDGGSDAGDGAGRVTVVLVSYNSDAVLEGAIASVPPGHEVIVVDNASQDRSREVAEEAGARVIALPRNLGFGTACNHGARAARHGLVLFLNPDARLEPGALEAMARALDEDRGLGAVNPLILGPDGEAFTRRRIWYAALFEQPGQAPDRRLWLSGAALMARRSVLATLGGFDEAIFLYFEDDDLAIRLLRAGHRLALVETAVVRHQEGRSSPASPALAAFKDYHFMRAQRHVMAKHGLPHARWREVARQSWRLLRSWPGSPRAIRARARLAALLDGSVPGRHR